MTKIRNGNWYKCDICGERFVWSSNCARWSSVILDETCPYEVPCACEKSECHTALEKNIKSGKFRLPKTKRAGYHHNVVVERQGY